MEKIIWRRRESTTTSEQKQTRQPKPEKILFKNEHVHENNPEVLPNSGSFKSLPKEIFCSFKGKYVLCKIDK